MEETNREIERLVIRRMELCNVAAGPRGYAMFSQAGASLLDAGASLASGKLLSLVPEGSPSPPPGQGSSGEAHGLSKVFVSVRPVRWRDAVTP